MDKLEIDKLIVRLIDNSISEEESIKLATWLEQRDNLNYFNEFIAINHLINSKQKFDHRYSLKEFVSKNQNKTRRLTNRLMYAAASVVVFISIAVFFNKNKSAETIAPNIIVDNPIKIGTNKATLTLEDGSVVVLEKGQKFKSNNVESTGEELVYKPENTKTANASYNFLTIPRGGEYYVKLSDGTEVWLNSESKLKYPVAFVEGDVRKVELLYGEAYFKVSPSTKHQGAKFQVVTGLQEVEVLGTEFNIKAYQDEDVIFTTLVEGKVSVNETGSQLQKEILKPSEQLALNKLDKSRTVSEVDVYSEIAWKKGLFSFKSKSLVDIMKVLSRWYDVDIVFEDKNLETIQFKGVLSKNQNITEILNLIKNTNFIKAYEIKQNQIIIKK
jgi:ferric-dicitrate binding protein FerR (iron transport regulator)